MSTKKSHSKIDLLKEFYRISGIESNKICFPIMLKADFEKMEIETGILIKRMTDDEIQLLFGMCDRAFDVQGYITSYKSKSTGFFDINFMHHSIYHPEEIDWQDNLLSSNYLLIVDDRESAEVFSMVLKAITDSTVPCVGFHSICGGGYSVHYIHPIPDLRTNVFIMDKNSKDIVKELFPKIKSLLQNDKKFKLIEEKFLCASSTTIRNDTSRFLEYAIILEMLLTSGDSRELTFRFALTLSKLLKKHYNENAVDIYKDGKDIYRIRSTIAHSGKTDKDLSQYLPKIQEYSRKIIRVYIKDPMLFDDSALEKLLYE